MNKNRSRKLPSTCKQCGVDFFGIYGEKNNYCSNKCYDEFRVMKWLPCSACMAKAGIGSKMAAKLLGITGGTISRQWKKRGIKRDERAGIEAGRLRVKIERQYSPNEMAQREALRHYKMACMEDIRFHSRFPDWGCEWTKEHQNKKSMRYYNSPESQYIRACNRDILRHNFKSIYPDWSSLFRNKNPQSKVKRNLRKRLRELIGTASKGGANIRSSFIGCSTSQLARHLESGFTKQMTWENYGSYWHVDHILPCAIFDQTNEKQRAQCWHWTNLRALEAKKNIDKGCNITEPQMSLLLCATS